MDLTHKQKATIASLKRRGFKTGGERTTSDGPRPVLYADAAPHVKYLVQPDGTVTTQTDVQAQRGAIPQLAP